MAIHPGCHCLAGCKAVAARMCAGCGVQLALQPAQVPTAVQPRTGASTALSQGPFPPCSSTSLYHSVVLKWHLNSCAAQNLGYHCAASFLLPAWQAALPCSQLHLRGVVTTCRRIPRGHHWGADQPCLSSTQHCHAICDLRAGDGRCAVSSPCTTT